MSVTTGINDEGLPYTHGLHPELSSYMLTSDDRTDRAYSENLVRNAHEDYYKHVQESHLIKGGNCEANLCEEDHYKKVQDAMDTALFLIDNSDYGSKSRQVESVLNKHYANHPHPAVQKIMGHLNRGLITSHDAIDSLEKFFDANPAPGTGRSQSLENGLNDGSK